MLNSKASEGYQTHIVDIPYVLRLGGRFHFFQG